MNSNCLVEIKIIKNWTTVENELYASYPDIVFACRHGSNIFANQIFPHGKKYPPKEFQLD